MNFKNLAENLIIVIVVAIVSGYVGYKASTKANERTIELLRPTIEEAIRKETTNISNEFKTEIKKLKTKNGETHFEITPKLDNTIESNTVQIDSTTTKPLKKKRKKFLGIF